MTATAPVPLRAPTCPLEPDGTCPVARQAATAAVTAYDRQVRQHARRYHRRVILGYSVFALSVTLGIWLR